MKGKLEVVCSHQCELGEGPVWDHVNKRIIWVDILRGEIHQLKISSLEKKVIRIGGFVGAVTLCSSGELLVALQNNFAFIREKQGNSEICIVPSTEKIQSTMRFNDAKCDPAGNFWAGTVSLSGKNQTGHLYMLDQNLQVTEKTSEVGISNGMAWSNDNKEFYYIDTAQNKVMKYDYDIATSAINNKKDIIFVPREMGKPDGMTIDEEGMVWIALWKGFAISRWNPVNGECLLTFPLPVSQVTSCTFGGENLDELYITSAKMGLTGKELMNEPLAGSLFVIKDIGIKGKLPANFSFKNRFLNSWQPL